MAMNTETHQEVEFCQRVEQLYEVVGQWMPGEIISLHREPLTLNEEGIGEYVVDKLILEDQAQGKVATLTPKGSLVIGAEGRVDLVGKYDMATLVWLQEDAPSTTGADNAAQKKIRFFFNAIESDGWYWIEDSRRAKAHPVTQSLFQELLWRVSDYELA